MLHTELSNNTSFLRAWCLGSLGLPPQYRRPPRRCPGCQPHPHSHSTHGGPGAPRRPWYGAIIAPFGLPTGSPPPSPTVARSFPSSDRPSTFKQATRCARNGPPRPFPPPFLSPPSSSFSDPLTTHYHSQDKRLSVRGELVRGLNNGDDAVLVTENLLGVNDGVGAWATKPRGHAAYVL